MELAVKQESDKNTEESLKSKGDTKYTVDIKPMSHQDAMATIKSKLSTLIQGDPLLSDLHGEITLEEVQSQIAVEYGQAMTVFVHKNDAVVVVQNGTVLDLKKAIRRHVTLKQARSGGTKHISWRYIWRSYWLIFEGQKLDDDSRLLKEYGIRNRADLKFIKRLKQK